MVKNILDIVEKPEYPALIPSIYDGLYDNVMQDDNEDFSTSDEDNDDWRTQLDYDAN